MKKLQVLLPLFLIVYFANAQKLTKTWEKFLNGSTPGYGRVEDILIDGNSIIVLSKDEKSDVFVKLTKLDMNGNLIWSKNWSVQSTDITPYYIQKSLLNANYYVLGYGEGKQPFITQFDIDGNLKKVKVFDFDLKDFKATKEGGFIVLGPKNILKVDANLDKIWDKPIQYNFSTGICCSNATSIDINQDGYIYILDSGTSLISNTSAEDIVVSKYDSTGTKVWNKYYGGLKTESISDSYANYRSEIKAHPDGGFVLQCITRSLEFAPSGSTAINEPIVIKGDINGIQKWWATIDRAATAAHGLKIKPNGNILLYGKGNTSPTSPFATPNDLKSKAFITELRNSDGKMIWGTSFGGEIDDENRALSIIDNQNFIVGGRHSEEFAWVYHVKLEGATHNSTIISNQDIFIYPNPVGSQLFVKTENHSNMEYSILGSNGNLIEKGNLKSENSIDVENLSPGIYFLNLTSYRETLFLKFIKF